MKLMTLVLASLLSIPTFALDPIPDAELRGAISSLSHRVQIQNRSYTSRAQNFSQDAMLGVGAGAILMKLTKQPENVFQFGGSVLRISAAMWIASHVAPMIYLKIKGHDAQSFRTAQDLDIFFALPLARQFAYARRDAELAEFLIRLDRWHQALDQALPGSADTPAPTATVVR